MSDTPVITQMRVIPVAGHDSMLLNIGGAHNCYFTRVLVVLTDSLGHTGVGESPGSTTVLNYLQAAIPQVEGQELKRLNSLVTALYTAKTRDAFSEVSDTIHVPQVNPEKHYNAVAAIEAAMLDLLGQFLDLPVAELLGPGKQRDQVPVLGYLFYIADRTKTDMDYLPGSRGGHDWYHLRHQAAMDIDSVVRLAEAAQDLYGFKDFKLKGGVHRGEYEIETVKALAHRFPQARITVDPNACWSLEEAIALGNQIKHLVPYIEDPCGAEHGFSGRETLAEFRRATNIPVATNMIANDWRQLRHALEMNAIDIPLADPHFWTMKNAVAVAQLCDEWGLTMGCHSNNHFDVSLAMITHLGAAAPGERVTPFDTHWLWQDGQRLTREPFKIVDGNIRLPDKPGLGIELDMEQVEKSHQLYQRIPNKDRNDAVGMQYLIKDWRFNGKRPTLLR
ncbi:enolase C-terminal domain-like protein [Acerihabitans arboris]|uniref:Glucarate dehydratase n=1 Tax=Acerihabitans arboris TaxID=2691583 RepID=A0A845SDL9_9GAMM|nr:enolase C-terminal domain-like protein [Acerihabitans arboris]NDL61492.1 glucarate dehydratase [Acerihabitans arboris]